MPIAAQCGSCQKRFKAPDKLAGKKVKCPQCGGVIAIPVAQPSKEGAGDLDGPAEPAPASAPAKAAPQPEPASTCPSCGAALVENAVLCVVCGYDLRTGQKLQTEHAAEAPAAGPQVTLKRKDWKKEEEQQEKKAKKKKKRKRERGETPQALAFLRGCAVSFGTTMLGVFIWWAVAWFTWTESGYIALLLGGLTGLGMAIGYGHEDMLPGIASAVIAFIGILIAKGLIIVTVVMSIAGDMEEFVEEVPDGEFAMEMADEEFLEEDMMEEESAEEAMIGEESAEEEIVADDQATDQGTSAAEMAEGGSFGEGLPDGVDWDERYDDAEAGRGPPFAEFVLLLFMSGGCWNLFLIVIACGAAYKVGSGGQWWED